MESQKLKQARKGGGGGIEENANRKSNLLEVEPKKQLRDFETSVTYDAGYLPLGQEGGETKGRNGWKSSGRDGEGTSKIEAKEVGGTHVTLLR